MILTRSLGIHLLLYVSGSPYLWDMPKTTAPITSPEVAQRVGDNIKNILTERGLTIDWLAGEIGIDTQTILKAFSSEVPLWLTLDASFYLEVAPDVLIGADR